MKVAKKLRPRKARELSPRDPLKCTAADLIHVARITYRQLAYMDVRKVTPFHTVGGLKALYTRKEATAIVLAAEIRRRVMLWNYVRKNLAWAMHALEDAPLAGYLALPLRISNPRRTRYPPIAPMIFENNQEAIRWILEIGCGAVLIDLAEIDRLVGIAMTGDRTTPVVQKPAARPANEKPAAKPKGPAAGNSTAWMGGAVL